MPVQFQLYDCVLVLKFMFYFLFSLIHVTDFFLTARVCYKTFFKWKNMASPIPLFCSLYLHSSTVYKIQDLQNSSLFDYCTSIDSFNWTLESWKHILHFKSKHLSMSFSVVPDISCISLTVMVRRLKDFAMNTNALITGTTPMSTTAASITPTSTLVHLRLWSVSRYVLLKHFTYCNMNSSSAKKAFYKQWLLKNMH